MFEKGRSNSYGPMMLVPLLAALALGGICFLLYWWQAEEVAKNQLDREFRRVEIFAQLFNVEVGSVVTDLQVLADGDGIQSYFHTGQKADLDRAIHRATFFSQHHPTYDQIRYLDEKGHEVYRVNLNGEVVPQDQLQDKSDRPYFQKTMALEAGQIFISAFDLNVERGKVEQPIKPMIRFAIPVFDGAGNRRGIFIINYLGQNLTERLANFVPKYKQRFRLLNPNGYWIQGARPGEEWGFMLADRANDTLAKSNPGLWQQIVRKPDGQVANGGGYFTWQKVEWLSAIPKVSAQIRPEDSFLVIASEISPAEWTALLAGLRTTFLIIGFVLLVLVAVSSRFFYSRQYVRRELDRFFTITRDMLCIAGFDGYFKRVNPAWSQVLGYTSQEMLEQPFENFVHPDDRERTRSESARLATGGETVNFENRYRCKDGTYRWLSWSCRSLKDEGIIFASARDLTERKENEEKILGLNADLRQRANQLEVANKELEAFSYSVSHDLRAPLRHINGFVELLQKAPSVQSDEKSMQRMGVIASAARQMGMLIDDLLAFSRTGRAEMHVIAIDMREMIDSVIGDLKMDAKGRQVEWAIQPLPKVPGDPALLRLVWVNLLANALKFTRKTAGAKIEIAAESDPQRGEIVFHVRDNGVGFDMQYAAKLFGVFQRLHSSADFEGTGIGLANVQRIIHRHGGRVWAESAPDKGATFYFSLPTQPGLKNHE